MRTDEVIHAAATYIDSWLGFRQRYLRIPGIQAAILFGDELVMAGAYGHADVEKGIALTTRHLFRVASHSKTFTGTAVLQLVESGRLRLDDRLGDWLAFVAEASSPLAQVTLRELLSHSGGVTRDGHDADFWQLREPFLDEIGLRKVVTDGADVLPTNERFKYSNIAYALLGLVITAASGRPYNEYVTREIVGRLGLANTGPELDQSRMNEYAAGYSALAYAEERVPIDHVDTRAMSPATGFYSTAEDLCRYAAAHFLGDTRLLSDAAKRLMQHEWWSVEGTTDESYGLGFSIVKVGERRLVGHSGGYPGHSTRTVFDPADRLAVSVLTNAIDGGPGDLAKSAVKIIDLATKQESEVEPAKERFCVRLANLWGVVDVALLGGRLLLLDPSAGDPTESCTELSVEDDATLRVVKGPGYGAVGERMRYAFGADGSVSYVRGAGGMTWWPLEGYRLPERVRRPAT